MSVSTISIAPAALRNPYAAAVGRIQPIQPVVVHDPADRAQARQSTPAASDTKPGATYTPSPRSRPGDGLYLRNGALQTSASASFSTDRQDSLELQIKTADGDIATINLAQSQSHSVSARASAAKGSASLEVSTQDKASLQVNMSVQGELDADETKSINALVQQINAVAQNFFAGDMEQAMAQAQGIDISQADTLGAFSLDLRSTEVQKTQKAVAAYQDVANGWVAPPPKAIAPTAAHATHDSSNTTDKGNTFMKRLLALLDGLKPTEQQQGTPAPATA